MAVEAEAAVEDAPEVTEPEATEAPPQDTDTEYQATVDKLEASMRASGTEEEGGAAEEVESTEDEKSYLGEDALEQIVKFKHNGEERELSVSELTAMAQKGYLWNDKNQELAERADELDAREQEHDRPQAPQTQTQQTQQPTEDYHAVADALNKFAGADEGNKELAQIAWANYQSNTQLVAKIQELESQVTGINTSAKQKSDDDRMTDDFRTILDVDSTLKDADLVRLHTEAKNAGYPSVATYYKAMNVDKIIAKGIEEGRAKADTAKENGRVASVRPAASSTRAKVGTKLDPSKMSEGESHQEMVNILNGRGYS